MRARLLILLRFFLLWLALQLFGRLLFLTYQIGAGATISPWDFLLCQLHGLRMDLSLLGYLFLLFSLLFLFGLPFNPRHFRRFFLWAQGILAFAVVAIIVSDCELFRNWQFRIDLTPFFYIAQPVEALASTPLWLTLLLTAAIGLLTWLFAYLSSRWAWPQQLHLRPARWWHAFVLLLVAASMFLPIRGSLGVAPMGVSTVAFSPNIFANQAAVNPSWHLIDELLYMDDMYTEDRGYMLLSEAQMQMEEIMQQDTLRVPLLRTLRPNIILLLMESQSAKFSGRLGRDSCTPQFDSLCREGVLFSRIYSASNRSDKGILGVLGGYPAQPKLSLIKFTRKLSKLPFFPNTLDSAGYNNSFVYGGDANFANIRTCLYLAGFHHITDISHFPKTQRNSKWGAHDEYTFARLLGECDTASSPFFKMLFTLTNHEPFTLPGKQKRIVDSEEKAMRRTMRYADSCMGDFIEQAKERAWWDSTLVIIIADHGHRYPGNTAHYLPESYHIPMLWLGGALRDSVPREIHTIGSQTDLAATLLEQLKLPSAPFIFSQDILSLRHGRAFYAFNNGFGWITEEGSFSFDHDVQRELHSSGPINDTLRCAGFAFYTISDRHYNDL